MQIGNTFICCSDYHTKIYTIDVEIPGVGFGFSKIWHKSKEEKIEIKEIKE